MTATSTQRLNDQMDSDNGFSGNGSHEESSLAILNRTEIDQQVATAKRYPRSIARAKQKMIEMATNDMETAQGCVYALKRNSRDGGSNFIEGPSIRLAEIAINAWGNIRAGARIIGEESGFIVAQGICHDLEANSFTSIEVRRRITNKEGRRYSDDMIGVTANAACAIALRNAVFKIVPKVFINPAYLAAQKLIAGDERSIGQRRQSLVEYFSKLHVGVPQIMTFLDKPEGGIDDITGDDLVRLHGVATAIRDGDTSIDDAFPVPGSDKPKASAANSAAEMNAKLDAAKAKKGLTPLSEEEANRLIEEKAAQARGNQTEPQQTGDGSSAPAQASQPDAPASSADQGDQPAAPGGQQSVVDGDEQRWPTRLSAEMRSDEKFSDKAVSHFKPTELSFGEARRKFKAKLGPNSWQNVPPATQDQIYEAMATGSFDWR